MMKRTLKYHINRGFTLLELMTAIAILAILGTIAVPSFVNFSRNSALVSTTNTLVASINTARSEAMKHGTFAMVEPMNGSDWNQGWRVFVDVDLDQSYNAANDILVLEQAGSADFLRITGNGSAAAGSPYVMFNGSGYPRLKSGGFDAVTLSIERTDGSALGEATTRRVRVSNTGRVRSCRPSDDRTCTAAAGS